MKKAAVPAALAVMLLDLLLGSGRTAVSAQSPGVDLDIDSDIQGEERTIIVNRMTELQPALRRFDPRRVQFLYLDAQGRPHSNRRRLKDAYRPTQGTPDDALLQDPYTGQVFVPAPLPKPVRRSQLFARSLSAFGLFPLYAQAAFTPPCGGDGTGPFRGVYTIDGTTITGTSIGYNFESAIIYLPGRAQGIILPFDVRSLPTGDTGYIFGGGFGSTGLVVDAGLQYNAADDNYGFFYRAQAGLQTPFPPGGGNPLPWRFQPNQNVFFMFFGAGVNHFAVAVAGQTMSLGAQVEFLDADLTGFDFTGRGMHLMRVTSIAQIKGTEVYNTGSFFGPVRWQQADLCCATLFQGWTAAATQQPTCWHAANGGLPDSTHVLTGSVPQFVSFSIPPFVAPPFIQNAANESVSIDLRVPSPPPPGCPPSCAN